MENNPFDGVSRDIANITASMNRSMDTMAKIQSEKNAVPFKIAKNTDEINKKVKSIDELLSKEQESREIADKKNHDESAKWHRIDFAVAVLGVLIGIAGLIVAILH